MMRRRGTCAVPEHSPTSTAKMVTVSTVEGILYLCLLCLYPAESERQPLEIERKLLDAIQYVESSGYCCAVGDKGKALGPYQIWRVYYIDAVQFNPSLADDGRTYEDVAGPGGYSYSEEVIRSYMGRYATRERLGHWPPTNEDIARLHKGGPKGHKKSDTLKYWNKVKKCLENPDLCPLVNRKCPSDCTLCVSPTPTVSSVDGPSNSTSQYPPVPSMGPTIQASNYRPWRTKIPTLKDPSSRSDNPSPNSVNVAHDGPSTSLHPPFPTLEPNPCAI